MDAMRFEGKTVQDALTKATIQLGMSSDQLEYSVESEGKTGFFGIGAKPAVILVKKKVQEEAVKEEPKRESNVVPKRESKKAAPKAAKKETKATTTTTETKTEVTTTKSVTTSQTVTATATAAKVDAQAVEKRAKEFLNQLFHAMKVETKIDLHYNESTRSLDIDLSGDDMGILIGKRGQTLDSIQYLTSLYVNKESEAYVRVKMDTENYRERRKETLEHLAKNIAYKVKRTRKPVSLEPMNPYERRIIHSALQNDRYVYTKSEGEEPYRKVVIMLKKS